MLIKVFLNNQSWVLCCTTSNDNFYADDTIFYVVDLKANQAFPRLQFAFNGLID